MENSILKSVKGYVGVNDDSFDEDILMNINAAFSTLYQIGVESAKDISVLGVEETWTEVFAEEMDLVDLCRQYVYLKCRVIFDPPSNSFVLDAIKQQISELEWRINVQAEGGFDEDEL